MDWIWLVLGWTLVYLLVGMIVFPLLARIDKHFACSDDAVTGMIFWPIALGLFLLMYIFEFGSLVVPGVRWVFRKISGVD